MHLRTIYVHACIHAYIHEHPHTFTYEYMIISVATLAQAIGSSYGIPRSACALRPRVSVAAPVIARRAHWKLWIHDAALVPSIGTTGDSFDHIRVSALTPSLNEIGEVCASHGLDHCSWSDICV